MTQPITAELVKAHGLSQREYQRLLELLGRTPNLTELGVFSVMWSEHCSYKSSRVHLKKLPTEGPRVIQGPGENAGVVDIGDGMAAVFKIESHNHPSFIEPYQGAATGVGGILRDIFTMGARPIALLNSLRFGELNTNRMRYLLNGVVEGIAGYGNCIGVPTVGGEIYFDPCYNGNILVNVFCLGIVQADKVFLGQAAGPGNAVLYVGSKTGRDGIHGASLLASAEFDEATEEKRPTVQVGDPFTEKLLLEAVLEAVKQDWVVGVQDMGAAGLTSSSFEMASRSGTGIDLDLDKVPLREEGMTAYEILLSESQERMLFVIQQGREDEALALFDKWDLDAAIVGRVTDQPVMKIRYQGEEVVNLPIDPVVDGVADTKRPIRKPDTLAKTQELSLPELALPEDCNAVLKKLLASPTIANKHWVYEQYDHMVRLNTLVLPGSDAAVMRIQGSKKALAISADCNSRYCYLDPFRGAQIAVAEACRNVVVSGGTPLGVTNCLNFGNPEKPEIMWQFEQAIQGISEFCRFFEIPVVSGNVSFYNETKGEAIFPTPTIAVVGLLEDQARHCTQWFKHKGDAIGLLGMSMEELGGSEYLKQEFGLFRGKPPVLDLKNEKKAQSLCLDWIQQGLLRSAHDCSEGGLAVALTESCLSNPDDPLGARVSLTSTLRPDAQLFGESQSRILVSFSAESRNRLLKQADEAGVPFDVIGEVTEGEVSVAINDEILIRETTESLKAIWLNSLERYGRQVP